MKQHLVYGDLRDQTGMDFPRPFLHCSQCDAEFSANKGDYFYRHPSEIIRCGSCDNPLTRVKRHTRLIPC